jgi:MraZ protein
MPFFTGSYDYTVDSKGRMNIPASFRKQLNPGQAESNVFITLNKIENFTFLCILTQDHFQTISSEPSLSSGGPFNPDPSKMRQFLSIMKEAQDCHYDEQGRLIIPKKFIEKADIRGQVTIVGAREYIQLWNPDAFQKYIGNPDASDAASAAS